MNNFSGFSSILALSKQLETITMLQKVLNPSPVPEGALSAIQQMSSLSAILGISPDISAKADQLSALAKKVLNPSPVPEGVLSAIQQMSSLSAIPDINPDISVIADQLSVLSKLDVSALTSGITIGSDTVKITRQAKETLDSLHEQFASIKNSSEDSSPDETPPASPAETEQSASQNEPDESKADSSLPPDPLLAENSSTDIYELSVPDFEEKYYAVLDKLIFALFVPFMIAYIFRTDFTPLTSVVSSWYEKYTYIETQKLNAELEHNELHKQQLEADQKHNELYERQLEVDQEHNELLRQLLETGCNCQLYKESIDSKP